MIRSRSNRNVVDPSFVQNQARAVAVLVATSTLRLFATGNWSSDHPQAADVVQVAHAVLAAQAELGVVCDAALAETTTSNMAQAAHQLVQVARQAIAAGQASLSCDEDVYLVHPAVDAMLIPAYSLLAIG